MPLCRNHAVGTHGVEQAFMPAVEHADFPALAAEVKHLLNKVEVIPDHGQLVPENA